jgi:hypothetical protein
VSRCDNAATSNWCCYHHHHQNRHTAGRRRVVVDRNNIRIGSLYNVPLVWRNFVSYHTVSTTATHLQYYSTCDGCIQYPIDCWQIFFLVRVFFWRWGSKNIKILLRVPHVSHSVGTPVAPICGWGRRSPSPSTLGWKIFFLVRVFSRRWGSKNLKILLRVAHVSHSVGNPVAPISRWGSADRHRH